MNELRSVVGAPVRGTDLWNRKNEIEKIWNALERDHILLVAPRRFGKTSLMLRLKDEPRENYRVFYLDTEWIKGASDFISEIAAELLNDKGICQVFKQIGGFFNTILGQVKEIQIAEVKLALRDKLAKDWQEKGREFIFHLKDVEGNVVVIVDEFPLMIERILRIDKREAEDFLLWFRGIRQMPELTHVRFVIGGSIGIEHVLKKADAGTKAINDLHRLQVGPFRKDEAREFLVTLLKNEAGLKRIPLRITDKFLEFLQIPIPYFIQILVSESIKEAKNQGSPLSEGIIEKAYYERVLASYNRTYFEHYYTRLGDYYLLQEEKFAKAFLLEIAKRGEVPRGDLWNIYQNTLEGKGNEENFGYLLSGLENDFYIEFESQRKTYHFATKVLRDWWLRHHAILR
ncbi:MAG: ATP-binding protein [Chloroflexota bacterium]|nr:ATP-binding protein [Chloroflexota bacterium]